MNKIPIFVSVSESVIDPRNLNIKLMQNLLIKSVDPVNRKMDKHIG